MNVDRHQPGQRATRPCPTTSGASSTSTPASPVSSLRASNRPAPAVIGVAIRNANRAAASRSRPANRPAEIEMPDRLMPGTSASAWATPMPTAIGNVTSAIARDSAADAVGDEQDHAADDERDRDEPDLAERRLDDVVEQQPDERRRDRRGDEQPGEPAVGVAARTSDRGRRRARPARGAASPPGSRRAARPACRGGASR